MKISIIDFHQSSSMSNSNKQTVSNNKMITRTTTTTTNYFNNQSNTTTLSNTCPTPSTNQYEFCSSFTVNKPIPIGGGLAPTTSNNLHSNNNNQKTWLNPNGTTNSRGKAPQTRKQSKSPPQHQHATSFSSTTIQPPLALNINNTTTTCSHQAQQHAESVVQHDSSSIRLSNCSSPPQQQQLLSQQQFRWNINKPNQPNKIVKPSSTSHHHQSRKKLNKCEVNLTPLTTATIHMNQQHQTPALLSSGGGQVIPSSSTSTSIASLHKTFNSPSITLSSMMDCKDDTTSSCNSSELKQVVLPPSPISHFPNLLSYLPSNFNFNNLSSSEGVGQNNQNVNSNFCKPAFRRRTSISLAEILN